MPDGADSDVSAISLSGDEAAPKQKPMAASMRRPTAVADEGAGGSGRGAAAGGSGRVEATAKAAEPEKRSRKKRGKVAFQLPEGAASDEDEDPNNRGAAQKKGGGGGKNAAPDWRATLKNGGGKNAAPDWRAILRNGGGGGGGDNAYDNGEADYDAEADVEGEDGGPDNDADDGAVQDETKPLGWSYFRKRDPGEGPVAWEEVDTTELGFVAESLVRSTTTRATSTADDVIQQIFHSVPGEDDVLVSDPLGRGVIDPFTLTLGKRSKMVRQVQPSSGEKGLKATMRTFRTARISAKQLNVGSGAAAGGGGGQGDGAGQGLDEEARKVLPNQEGFEPEAFLAAFHAESSRSQLDKGLRALSKELSERTGQLKMLIRNNFDRFINCKDAIDDIHAKLRKMVVRGAGPSAAAAAGPSGAAAVAAAQHGVGTDRVFRSLEQVEANARRTFGPILERAAKADRIRAVTSLLQRFDHLFAAPHRAMELAGRGELEQVVREYKRANMLIRPTATTARVWVSLYAEIEKRVTEVYLAVRQLVTEPPPETGRPMGQDGPTVLFGVVAGSSGAGDGGGARGGIRKGAGVVVVGSASSAAGLAVAAGGGAGDEVEGGGVGQQRLTQLPDYLLFLTLVRQERLPAARDDDAMRMYVSKLEAHVEERMQACDRRHTEQLEQLVATWMRATGVTAPGGGGGGGGGGGAAASGRSGGLASLQASFSSLTQRQGPGRGASGALDAAGGRAGGGSGGAASTAPTPRVGAGGGKAAAAGGNGDGDDDDDEEEEDGDVEGSAGDLEEDGEVAEAAFLLWQGGAAVGPAAASPFSDAALLPYRIRSELRRLVQDPGGPYGPGGSGSAGASGGSTGGTGGVEPLPTSAHAAEPVLTSAQRQWVSYVCGASALLLWAVPGLWATCHSPKYGNQPDLEEPAREGLGRGPSLARRLVEGLCSKYAQRLKRAVASLCRAGPMQPGLPLIIKDACHLWSALRSVGVGSRALSTLREGVLAALAAHVGLLGDHLAELPVELFGADDFRLDLLAADQQPVTALPRRLEEEVGVALLHYQWPLMVVADAAGGMEEVPPESGWRPMQGSVLACFSLLSEALAEYARSLYADGGGGGGAGGGSLNARHNGRGGRGAQEPAGDDGSSLAAAPGSSSTTASSLLGSPMLRGRLSGGGGVSGGSLGGSAAAAADALDNGGGGEGAGSGSGIGDGGSSDVRVLLVISNSAVIRTRVMPGVVERHRRLLAPSAEASATCQRRLRELTSSMRRSNEALGSSYLGRKETDVKAAVARYIAAETAPLLSLTPSPQGTAAAAGTALAGTGAGAGSSAARSKAAGGGTGAAAAPPPLLAGPVGPSAGCVSVLQLLNAIHNEALAYSPSNLRPFMVALAEHLVDRLVGAYQSLAAAAASTAKAGAAAGGAGGGGGASVEQLVQLWADLSFLAAALRPLLTPALAAELGEGKVVLGSAIASRQRSRRYRPASAPAAAVAGLGDGEAISAELQELLAQDVDSWLRRHALNVRCFTAAAAPAAAAAERETSSSASKAAAPGAAAREAGGASSRSEAGGRGGGEVAAGAAGDRGRRGGAEGLGLGQQEAPAGTRRPEEGSSQAVAAAALAAAAEARAARRRRAAG